MCADYDRTLTVARNAQGDVFGGYASRTFGVRECCVVDGNECYGTQALTYCYDRNAAGSFIFSLVGALIPAAKAADTDPVNALRYE